MLGKKHLLRLLQVGFFLYISLFFFQKINLTASDLGRHIQNGNVMLQTKSVFATNYYSYTFPDLEVTNHHWLFGIIASVLFKLAGFPMLTAVSAILYVFSLFLLTQYVKQWSSHRVALVSCLVCLPLLTYRTEFRPEIFSVLFVIINYILLSKFNKRQLTLWQIMLFLIPIQIAWVNVHIFFIFSLVVVGVFGLNAMAQGNWRLLKEHIVLGSALALASLCNPLFVQGLIEPFTILQTYGYQIAENQGLFFLSQYQFQALYGYVFALSICSCVCIFLIWKRGFSVTYLPEVLLAVLFLLAGLKMSRLLTFTGIFFVPLVAAVLTIYQTEVRAFFKKAQESSIYLLVTSSIALILLVGLLSSRLFFPQPAVGFGVYEQMHSSAEFFKNNSLTGAVFNNYDIGGYLIFHLFPETRVFVDNRPEAYPSTFFTDQYIPMQESETVWQEALATYDFNIIYFYRHDLTPWAQMFLLNRVNDEAWVPVFVDNYTIIFVKNSEKNKEVIENYRLPKDLFGVSNTEIK